MPITATALLRFWDMACSLALEPLARFVTGGAGARPDHSISGHRVGRWRSAGAVAALSVNAKMVVPKRPGRFYGVRCQFLVPNSLL